MARLSLDKGKEIDPLPGSQGPSTVQLAVGGMTCSSCVRTITEALSKLEGVSEISLNQLGKSASAVVASASLADSLATLIEDLGYEAQVLSVTPLAASQAFKRGDRRTIALEFKGMRSITEDMAEAVQKLDSSLTVEEPHTSDPPNVIRLSYAPDPPAFTIRTLVSSLSQRYSPTTISIYHPPSADETALKLYRKEQRSLLIRLLVAVLLSIPIFVIGIVYMSLVRESNPVRRYFQSTAWAGQVPRGEWILFILATPIMFFSAAVLWFLWRPGFFVSLGVSVAYFSSIAELAISARTVSNEVIHVDGPTTYFDSVAFLTMFLLIGRFIEAFSKHQAANAVTLLGNLRSSEALLLISERPPSSSFEINDEKSATSRLNPKVETIPTDLLEVGDIVRVPAGASPPSDGVIVSSEPTFFDESSLTGESRDVQKSKGDQIFVGTINKLRVVDMIVEAVEEGTMLEQVINAVRQGQSKRAPVEKVVDILTSYFVPVVTALAIITWIVWLSLGLSGALPADTLSSSVGGWAFWSLEFAISVFVIACPCGIGLAAPTALLVGSGLAAKHGILARGGGEAFQEASQIDVIVFDKTGTLTEGNEPKVTDVVVHPPPSSTSRNAEDVAVWDSRVLGIVLQLASGSSHPLSLALRNHLQDRSYSQSSGSEIEEIPGCGVKGNFHLTNGEAKAKARAMLGNDTWLSEHGAIIGPNDADTLQRLRQDGKSVVLLALALEESAVFTVCAFFAIADPIRQEASPVVARLQTQGIETWMISGDNQVTARAVARSVGIPSENVIAGVLPNQKAEKIQWLQTLPRLKQGRTWYGKKVSSSRRKIVAMVGDGINDAPALTAADVGIAMGSGSDIALSSAHFVLLTSNLRTLLTLTDLSKKVFRRIEFNFGWATVYNLITLPIAAGVIYPAGHSRLSPVWSSLAMALSSTSVVCSSLLLRLYKEPKFEDVGSSLKEESDNRC
ncbi:E1-E2 ATPase-domain-containing protein [Gymnopilus junonius]|uniref:E1-E2 ATPase-domain-containing protein n=1 Tax=Gymnopilus junonius TaxID=109634 RepID=A0A9P5NC22_GYMJU|nr:E1-E2 ATPase-domain-containing protein [Gymnopilus junonius]